MTACTTVLILSLIGNPLAGDSPQTGRVDSAKAVSKKVNCAKPDGYSVVEADNPGTNDVNIVQGDKVLWTIKVPTGVERNGFALDWAKKTKEGFEIAVEYGSVIFYSKRFNFICKQGRFYLSKIIVSSFNRHNPEKGKTWVVRPKRMLPLEKFVIDDFMLEGSAA